jgi:hypothetical protein
MGYSLIYAGSSFEAGMMEEVLTPGFFILLLPLGEAVIESVRI